MSIAVNLTVIISMILADDGCIMPLSMADIPIMMSANGYAARSYFDLRQ